MGDYDTLTTDWTTDFVKNMVDNSSNYVNTNLIQAATGSYIEGPYTFLDLTVGESLKRLTQFDGYSFYVDVVDDSYELRYFKPSNTTSITVTEDDIVEYEPFTWSDFDLCNSIVIKGPVDVSVSKTDGDSISTYGEYRKVITNPLLESDSDATRMADAYIRRYGTPKLNGSITIQGDETINLQKGITFDVDYINISGTHNILGYTHKLNKDGFYTTIDFGETEFDINSEMSLLKTNIDMTTETLNEGPPGSDTYVIFNDEGDWGSDENFTWDGAELFIDGDLAIDGGKLSISHGAMSVLIGEDAGGTGGQECVALGQSALKVRDGGRWDVAVGPYTMDESVSDDYNTAIGYAAQNKVNGGEYNTAIGAKALLDNVTGDYNVALGNQAGENETGSNKLYISNSDTSYPLIYGEFDNHCVKLGDGSAWDGELTAGKLIIDEVESVGVSSQAISGGAMLTDLLKLKPVKRNNPAPVVGEIWMSSNGTNCGGLYTCTGSSWRRITLD